VQTQIYGCIDVRTQPQVFAVIGFMSFLRLAKMFLVAILALGWDLAQGRRMAKETTGEHSAEALVHLAQELEDHAASLRAASALLTVPAPIDSLTVRYENSRTVGFEYLRNWVGAVKQAAYDARLEAMRRNGVSREKKPESRPKKS
jgi:hypothetical protein